MIRWERVDERTGAAALLASGARSDPADVRAARVSWSALGSQSSDIAVCGAQVAMAKSSEMDWCTAPTCLECNTALIEEFRW
ncbi:hypothetical protein GCM10010470_15580 [Saccharopolyspora taberi]|uniref:Uncharacterized protein n=1 Tax=Saccharopolyspora taberi TaxID=60895 RepID=A0ABN3V8T8_9PSEU